MKLFKTFAIIFFATFIGFTGISIKSYAATPNIEADKVLHWDTCSIGESVIDISTSKTGYFKGINVTLENGDIEDGLKRGDLYLHKGAGLRFTCPDGDITRIEISAVGIHEQSGICNGWTIEKRNGSTIVGVDESYVLVWTGAPSHSVILSANELGLEFVTQGTFYITQ